MRRIYLFIAALGILYSCSSAPSITDMRVEWCESPICVDTQTPRFTWNFGPSEFMQRSFDITIRDAEGSEVWNSGIVETGEMNYRSAEDMGLNPMSSYKWQVAATGSDGRKVVSDEACFETALFS